MELSLVGKGNANILIDFGDPKYLYRCCIKYMDSISKNNEFTLENAHFIDTHIKPLMGDLVCPMELIQLPVSAVLSIYSTYVKNVRNNQDIIYCFRISNLRPSNIFTNLIQTDHLTKIYASYDMSSILLEIKPKWLHNPMPFCRNCTHNLLKKRDIKYCYSKLLNVAHHFHDILLPETKERLPNEFTQMIIEYFDQSTNFLQNIHDTQQLLYANKLEQIRSEEDIDNKFLLLMTLRDITCFVQWDSTMKTIKDLNINVVDVDLKKNEKWPHWVKTHNQLKNWDRRISH